MTELQGFDPAEVRPQPSVVLYHAAGCHLCERARGVLAESGFAFEEIDITGDPQLEATYRDWLPVVEIDGERAFVYYVDPAAFARRLSRSTSDPPPTRA
jgi:glutaredoxin